jgi:hypothetical protein
MLNTKSLSFARRPRPDGRGSVTGDLLSRDRVTLRLVRLLLLLSLPVLSRAAFKAGAGRVDITPTEPVWLSGYSARTHASEGVLMPIWTKALAIENSPRDRIVIVTTDVIGIPREVADRVAARLEEQYHLPRSRLLLNASHTHTGPIVWPGLKNLFVLPAAEEEKLQAYQRRLIDAMVKAAGDAIESLQPASISFGEGQAGFAVNRRLITPEGVKNSPNPDGPVDHSVPVLRITGMDGRIRVVLFGYACHNTTLTAQFYAISGDYAGFAQHELEKAGSGTMAMFLMLCGGDQNPNPRSTLELAKQHGKTLADEVQRVLTTPMREVRGPIGASFDVIDVPFAPHNRQMFEAELNSDIPARVLRARAMLDAYDRGKPVVSLKYPIQAFRFGQSLTLAAFGGETLVEYALAVKARYRGEPIVVAGYSNDVMSYIASQRALRKGGYEVVDSMAYYNQPGPLADSAEKTILDGLDAVMRRVGRKPSNVER